MLKSDIKYSLVTEESNSAWSLRDKYRDTIIIWIYTSRHVGLQGALQGKGSNASSIQLIFDLALEKGYDITEVYCKGGETLIAMYLEHRDTSGEISRAYRRQEGERNIGRKAIEANYEMCLKRVITLLKKNNVDQKIIHEVRQIKPYNN